MGKSNKTLVICSESPLCGYFKPSPMTMASLPNVHLIALLVLLAAASLSLAYTLTSRAWVLAYWNLACFLAGVSHHHLPSFSLLTGLLASYICSALYLLHTETNSRWLENIFTASTIFLLSLSLWLLFATRDSEQVEAFDYSAQECRIL